MSSSGRLPLREIRLLVVVDGYFSLGARDRNDRSFSMSHLISILKSTTLGPDNQFRVFVDTAHRDGDSDATICGKFNFVDSLNDLNYYDEIWLFGYSGYNVNDPKSTNFTRVLEEREIRKIADFMQNGGGVLADGDHDSVGSFMCGRLPRVRTMRKWFASKDESDFAKKSMGKYFGIEKFQNWPAEGENRADTLQPDVNGSYNFTNQSDDRPQPLELINQADGKPHPLLEIGGPNGPFLKKFPDHFHEGEVLGFGGEKKSEPWSVEDKFVTSDGKSYDEYPANGNGKREVPQIIAMGGVIGGHSTNVETDKLCNSGFGPDLSLTVERKLNILSVFDGRKVGVGRVLTDSSFHHFLDLNLIGDPCASEEKTQGFNHLFLKDMKQFYLNCVLWLAKEKVWGPKEDLPARIRSLV